MFSNRWLFQVCWNGAGDGGDGGDGTSGGGDGTSGDGATGFGGSVSFGGSPQGQGGIGSDAVAGGTANATAPAGTTSTTGGTTGGVGGVSATGGFGHGGVGAAGPSGTAAAGGAATGGGAGTAAGGSGTGPGFGAPSTPQEAAQHANALQALFNSQHSSQVTNPGVANLLGHAANIGVGSSVSPSALAALARGAASMGAPSPSLSALAQALFGSTNFGGGIGGQIAATQANQNAQIKGINDALAGLFGNPSNAGQGGIGSDAVAGGTTDDGNVAFGPTGQESSPPGLGVNTNPFGYGVGPSVGVSPDAAAQAAAANISTDALGTPTTTTMNDLAPHLGPNVIGPNSLSPTMGYPAVEGVSPGVTAMPGPSPTQFGPPAQPSSVNTTNLSPSQTPYGVTTVVASPNLSPTQKATTVAHTLSRQSPTQQSHTISQAITTAQKTMTPPAYESFLTSLIGYYTPTTGNARAATYHAGQ